MSRIARYDEGTELSTEQILKTHEVPWESFTSLRLISDRDAQLIRKYDKRKHETQAELLEQVSCLPEPMLEVIFGPFLMTSRALFHQFSVLRYNFMKSMLHAERSCLLPSFSECPEECDQGGSRAVCTCTDR